MLKYFDWQCDVCPVIREFLTQDGRPPETPCICGAQAWVRKYPAPATTFKHAGRFIPKAGTSIPKAG